MKLALHLRKIPANHQLPDIPGHLGACYDDDDLDLQLVREKVPPVERIYVGDEFCPIRLPAPNELARFCRFSTERNIGLTLLVPVLTDAWLDHCTALFECLEKWCPEAEVVVNDIGTIFFLRKNHPVFRISMGRLFNKGFKDPRLSSKNMEVTPEINNLLSESTFDHTTFQHVMERLNVKRLERDLMPHSGRFSKSSPGYQTSYYFPFGYITTGRVCRTATFDKKTTHDFAMLSKCSKPCNALSFRLKNDAVSLKLIQAGNTIFYLYSLKKLNGLLEKAAEEDCRLIYQGLAI